MHRIGIRREDKSRWEARVPLVPEDVGRLMAEQGLEFGVQSSPNRAFGDAEYRQAGASVAAELGDCPVILGVKEIPSEFLEPHKTYVYFSHTIKGQAANMPMLRRLMDLECQLIDYERITDNRGRRLVFFGRYAGLAGMIDTLWALGQRLAHEGWTTPFERILPAHRYENLEQAKQAVSALGETLRRDGVPEAVRPLVCGFAGYGQVSQGAQEIYDLLGVEKVDPEALADRCGTDASSRASDAAHTCFKVVFKEQHLVTRADGSKRFQLQEYYDHPDRYRADFFRHVPHLTLLVNCIYWEPKYPRLITNEQLAELYGGDRAPRLRVIGEITCDVEGSIECLVRCTDPGNPVYVFEPTTGLTHDGVAGRGPVVLGVDFLPCELPVDSSVHFSRSMSPWIPTIAGADFRGSLPDSGLPPELSRATILWQGQLTEPYRYLHEFVE